MAAVAAGLIGAAQGGAPEAAPSRSGQVVRVERPHRGGQNRIRFCTTLEPGDKLACFGNPLMRRGELIDLLDGDRHLGRARVLDAEPYEDPSMTCGGANALQQVRFEMVDQVEAPRAAFGLTGVSMRPDRVKVVFNVDDLPPASNPDGLQFQIGIDGDGDGRTDVAITVTDCSDHQRPLAAGGRVNCLEYWVRQLEWKRVGQDVFYDCH